MDYETTFKEVHEGHVLFEIEAKVSLVPDIDDPVDWQIECITVETFNPNTRAVDERTLPRTHWLYRAIAAQVMGAERGSVDVRWAMHIAGSRARARMHA